MLFNRHGLQQKNWRMVKKGKHILFGCSLFFVVGGMSVGGSQVANASEANPSRVVEGKVVTNNTSSEIPEGKASTLEKEQVSEDSNDKTVGKIKQTQDVEKPSEKEDQKENLTGESGEKSLAKKEVDKKELKNLVDKIKKTDISKKTEKSVKELSLILSRVEKALDNKEITQEEIDKEVKALKEAFEKLEDKPKEDKKSEAKEKAESKKEEQSNAEKNTKEKQKEHSTEDVARKHNEKITKVTETVTEIHSIANQINYEFSDAEKELVKTAENLSTAHNSDKNNGETIQKLLKEVIYLRNKVANRMTRAHSGKRDPRNGKVIDDKDESRFRAITLTPIANLYEGSNNLVNENKKDVIYYNGDTIFSVIQVSGKRGPGEALVRYPYGPKRGEEDPTPYYIKRVGIISGLEYLTGVKLRVAYKDFQTGQKKEVEITSQYWNVNNPDIQMAFVGTIGNGGNVTPGTYNITLGANGTNRQATITYTFTIKSQSERNTVRDLTPTYVDDVRHLTETEKTALIEKFKAEHPNVVNRAHHIDFERAEVSADGATMTIHFKDGFSTKTIQTNAQNDVEAKHSSLTTLVGDPHEFYKNPRNLVKSKTNHEVPQTARVTWKTPFDFSQPGTKNAVVTVSYDNGVTKDVTTPYTVLDFIGKQDKRIFQNQSGELGDARSYITLSNGTAPATDLMIRWKGGSSVDTSAQGTQRKEIEILRGNTVMKTVTIPVAIVDNINPTITATDSVLLTRAEGLPNNISVDAQDNPGGIGLRDTNPIVVENLANPLRYNPSTKRIELSGLIPNNFQRTQATIKAVDKNGNTATKTITFNVQAQTDKYTATANSQIQTVSYRDEPSAEVSINKTGLPAGTTYAWKTKPDTSSPGNKSGVVEVTYPDTSKDTVNVTISVRKLSDEYAPTGNKIVRNQNAPITNGDLKAAVTISNNGNSKVKSVTPVGTISTATAGTTTIKATVTYLDNTSDPVDIPLEVKDVTAPTIQTPTDRQNWDLIALDRTLPPITVTSVDNNGGTGVKSTTVTGLPDFLVYDNATKTIKFKNGVQEVTKLPVGQNSKTYTATIQVTDNVNNSSQRQVTITVKSMTMKYNATPNGQKQTVSYGDTPDAGTSINKNGLPTGTRYTWATTPNTTTGPGDKAGVVTVTYPDDSTDTVNVTVNVRALNDEYNLAATEIVVNQNAQVTNDDLKAKVTATSKVGNVSGTDKISTVVPKSQISTANYGDQNIRATVTFKDGTRKDVTIPLKVKDVTKPTITLPAENTNWEITALDKTLPNMEVRAEDNANGSGIKLVSVTGLPDYLEYDKTTNSLKFKAGKQEVEKLSPNTPRKEFTLTIRAEDNAGNISEKAAKITVYSMSEKNTPTPLPQTVDNGTVPNAEDSVDKTGLPSGTTIAWKETPVVNTPGSHPTVALVTYPDGTVDEVTVPITVKEQKDTYNPTAKQPNQTAKHGSEPSAEGSINTNGLPSGTTYTWVEKPDTNTTPGSKPGKVLITYPDNSTEEVPVTVEVTPQKDDYDPQPKPQTVDNGTVPNAEDSVDKTGLPSGTTIAWKETPVVNTPGSHPTVALVTYPDGTVDEVTVPIVVRQINTKGIPEVQPDLPEFNGGVSGEPEEQSELPPEFNGGVNGEPEEQPMLPEFNGGVKGDPEVQPTLPEFKGEVKGDPEVQPALPEFNGGVNGDPEEQPELPEFNGGVNGNSEVQPVLPEFNGGVKGDPEIQPTLPEFKGGVNGDPETQPTLPEFRGGVNGEPDIQSELPRYVGRVHNESEIRSNFRDKTSSVAAKRLANTGETQSNSELAGLGLAIVGLIAAMKRRKKEEE